MSPRPYHSVQRDAASAATRQRIVRAAIELVSADAGVREFTMEAVARQAGVSRVTVYYQFGSRRELLDASFDELAERGGIADGLSSAFRQVEAGAVLDGVVDAFMTLWAAEPSAMRRFRSLAAVDPSLESDLRERDGRRRTAVGMAAERLVSSGALSAESRDEAVDALDALLSFEVWDLLGGRDGRAGRVGPIVRRLARRVIGIAED